jgi:hypothetical protein
VKRVRFVTWRRGRRDTTAGSALGDSPCDGDRERCRSARTAASAPVPQVKQVKQVKQDKQDKQDKGKLSWLTPRASL